MFSFFTLVVFLLCTVFLVWHVMRIQCENDELRCRFNLDQKESIEMALKLNILQRELSVIRLDMLESGFGSVEPFEKRLKRLEELVFPFRYLKNRRFGVDIRTKKDVEDEICAASANHYAGNAVFRSGESPEATNADRSAVDDPEGGGLRYCFDSPSETLPTKGS